MKNLEIAKSLELPSREATLMRTNQVHQFWQKQKDILAQAWREWEKVEDLSLITLDDSLINPDLRKAVE